jgi:hypothetical protein
VITDYGGLVQMTAVMHPLLGGAAAHDLSFSSPSSPGGAIEVLPASQSSGGADESGTPGTATGAAPGAGTSGVGASGGGTPGGGGTGSGHGGSLPFTGFAPGIVGVLGAGFTAAGAAIRRALKRSA